MYAPKRLAQFMASTTETIYYTVPASTFTIVKNIVLANNNPSPVSVNLSVVPSGQIAGYENRIIPGVSIPANTSVPFDVSIVMATGDFISASATTGSVVAVTISGVEESGNALTTGGTAAASTMGITPVTSSTRPSSPTVGQSIYETDTGKILTWSGLTWTREQPTSTLGYAQIVATQTSTNTVAPGDNIVGLSVTVTVPAGRRLKITGFGWLSCSATAQARIVIIDEGNNYLADSGIYLGSNLENQEISPISIITPTAGTHTYRLAMRTSAGTLTFGGYSTIPGFILVEDITGDPSPYVGTATPVGQLGYANNTADTTLGTSLTDIVGCSVNVVVPAGRTLRITGHFVLYNSQASSNQIVVGAIREGSTTLVAAHGNWTNVSGSFGDTSLGDGSVVLSPSAGSHTYKLSALATNTGGLALGRTGDGSGNFCWINVEDITPTPALASSAPSSTLGYAEVTANQTGITTTPVTVTGLSVTATVAAGRRVRITAKIDFATTAGTPNVAELRVLEDGTQIQRGKIDNPDAQSESVFASVIRTPTAGSHTWTLQAMTDTGTITAVASSTLPGYILVEDITAAATLPVPSTNGVAIVASNNRPASPVEGQTIYETDTDLQKFWNNSNWVTQTNLRMFSAPATILNTAPAVDTGSVPFKTQMGTAVAGTDASGYVTINYGSAYPGGVVSVLVMQGDQTHAGATFCVTTTTLSSFTYRMFNTSGAAWVNSGNHRVNWIAIGW